MPATKKKSLVDNSSFQKIEANNAVSPLPANAPRKSARTSYQSHLLFGLILSPYSLPNPAPIADMKPLKPIINGVMPISIPINPTQIATIAHTQKCAYLSAPIV